MSGARSDRGLFDSQERKRIGISHAQSTIGFPPYQQRPTPRETERGRTTTLLISSEFERSMVLSYRGDASLIDPELSTPVRGIELGSKEASSQRGTPAKRKGFDNTARRREQLADSIMEKAEKQRHEPIREHMKRPITEEAKLLDVVEERRAKVQESMDKVTV